MITNVLTPVFDRVLQKLINNFKTIDFNYSKMKNTSQKLKNNGAKLFYSY